MAKEKMLKRDWTGRHVVLRREVSNGRGNIFPAGTIMTVDRNYNGLHLRRAFVCKECANHYRATINGIVETTVDLLPKDFMPDHEKSKAIEDARAAIVREAMKTFPKMKKPITTLGYPTPEEQLYLAVEKYQNLLAPQPAEILARVRS
jgi:hypothetical protein